MVRASPSLACMVLEYELESLDGGTDFFGPKSHLGIPIGLVALMCSLMGIIGGKEGWGPQIGWESKCIARF